MLQSAKYGATVVCRQQCIPCTAKTENQTFETLGYLSVIVSGHFLNRGSHSIATMIPRDFHLHKIFSPCRPVGDYAIMLFTTSVPVTVENTISLLSMIFETAVL